MMSWKEYLTEAVMLFSKEIFEALSQASVNKQKELQDLIVEIVEEWLKKNFYIGHIS